MCVICMGYEERVILCGRIDGTLFSGLSKEKLLILEYLQK